MIEYEYKWAPEKPGDSYVGLGCAGVGGTETDKDGERWIAQQLKAGNRWAWCAPRVKAEISIGGETFRAVISDTCTSAWSEADYHANFYEDACEQARRALLQKLATIAERGAAATRALIELLSDEWED
jgi:hypothetical protein